MKALRIDTDGKMQPVEITGGTIGEQNDSIYEHLGSYFDIVHIADDAVMLVDDVGLLKALPLNPMAMMIAHYGSPLVGTALVLGLMWTYDGDVFADIPERFLRFADRVRQIKEK